MPNESPLSEPDPRSLDDLFAADPLSLTDEDIDRIVDELRTKRALWEREDAEAKQQSRARRPTAYRDPPKKGTLTLKDLGIGKKHD